MTTDLTGRIVAVNTLPLGDVLAADAPIGSTSITVTDGADFAEAGGWLFLGGTSVVSYTSADDETGVITLSSATTVAFLADDRVEVWDPALGAVIRETRAQVEVEGPEQSADTLEAIVLHTLIPLLPDGIRDSSIGGEAVAMEYVGDDLYVVNVLARTPMMDGQYMEFPTGNSIEGAPATFGTYSEEGTALGLVMKGPTGANSWEYPARLAMWSSEPGSGNSEVHLLASEGLQIGREDRDYIDNGDPRLTIAPGVERFGGALGDYVYLYADKSGFGMDPVPLRISASTLELVGGTTLKGLGRVLSRLDFGQKVGTTDADSRVTVSHDLGVVPISITATSRNTHIVRVFSSSSTQFTLEFRAANGSGLVGAGVSVTCDWLAIA